MHQMTNLNLPITTKYKVINIIPNTLKKMIKPVNENAKSTLNINLM